MCYHLTRFTREELKTLYHLFFGAFPENSYTFCTVKITYEETILIAYMANGTKYIAMSQVYGGDWSRYSYIDNWFAKFLYHKYYHRLCSLHRYELPGNYPVFTVVMVISTSVRRIMHYYLTPDFF